MACADHRRHVCVGMDGVVGRAGAAREVGAELAQRRQVLRPPSTIGHHGIEGPCDQRAADTVHAGLAPPSFAICAFRFFALWTLCGGWHHAQHACPHAAAYLLISSFRITQLGGLCFIFWVPILYILVPWAVLSYLQVGTSPSQSITEYHALQQLEAAIFGIIGHTYIDHNFEEGNYIGL